MSTSSVDLLKVTPQLGVSPMQGQTERDLNEKLESLQGQPTVAETKRERQVENLTGRLQSVEEKLGDQVKKTATAEAKLKIYASVDAMPLERVLERLDELGEPAEPSLEAFEKGILKGRKDSILARQVITDVSRKARAFEVLAGLLKDDMRGGDPFEAIEQMIKMLDLIRTEDLVRPDAEDTPIPVREVQERLLEIIEITNELNSVVKGTIEKLKIPKGTIEKLKISKRTIEKLKISGLGYHTKLLPLIEQALKPLFEAQARWDALAALTDDAVTVRAIEQATREATEALTQAQSKLRELMEPDKSDRDQHAIADKNAEISEIEARQAVFLQLRTLVVTPHPAKLEGTHKATTTQLERKKGVIGTMQRMIFAIWAMIWDVLRGFYSGVRNAGRFSPF